MALSPAHRFGQIIGEVLEAAIEPLLAEFARRHGLYLDKRGERPCRKGTKCSWVDLNKNTHDLDFVLERGGTAGGRGTPVAFIETAWRRYTKHSRNKAQEIQGAIMPLVQTYKHAGPFTGAVLAGVFTDGALTQLKSLGFSVLYFPYEVVVAVFRKFRIDAAFDEDTPDANLQHKVDAYEAISEAQKKRLARALAAANKPEVEEFIRLMDSAVSRRVERVVILPLHGTMQEVSTLQEAIAFITSYDERSPGHPVHFYEVQIRYSNGDRIDGRFQNKPDAIKYLRGFLPGTA